MHRAKYGEGGGAPMPSGRATPPKSPRVPQPRSSLNPILWVFMEALID